MAAGGRQAAERESTDDPQDDKPEEAQPPAEHIRSSPLCKCAARALSSPQASPITQCGTLTQSSALTALRHPPGIVYGMSAGPRHHPQQLHTKTPQQDDLTAHADTFLTAQVADARGPAHCAPAGSRGPVPGLHLVLWGSAAAGPGGCAGQTKEGTGCCSTGQLPGC